MESDEQAKINTAQQFKAEGNELFRASKYKEALKKYARVFLYVEGLIMKDSELGKYSRRHINEQQQEEILELKASTYLNMAAIDIKLDNWTKAVERTTKSLEIKPNPKAYYRRGYAYMKLDDLDRAEADLKTAQSLQSDDSGIEQALRELSIHQKRADKKAKRTFGGMFDRMRSEESKTE